MESIYIVAIVVGSVVLFLFAICLLVMIRNHRREIKKREELESVYSDPNLAKMEYDLAVYDEETNARIVAMRIKNDTQVTIEDVMENSGKSSKSHYDLDEISFNKVDDGVEKISGHYVPED